MSGKVLQHFKTIKDDQEKSLMQTLSTANGFPCAGGEDSLSELASALRFSAKLKWCRICSICIQVYCKYAGKRFLSIDAASVMMSDVNPERNLTELTV